MRCLECGGEMMAVASDDAVGVDGFKYQALQCLSCESTERRLVFNRGLTETTVPPPGGGLPAAARFFFPAAGAHRTRPHLGTRGREAPQSSGRPACASR
jgi:hypothetical protein